VITVHVVMMVGVAPILVEIQSMHPVEVMFGQP